MSFIRSTILAQKYIPLLKITGCSLIFAVLFNLLFVVISNFSPITASAAAPTLNLAPGQVARIVIYYDNSSTTNDFTGTGSLKVGIDEKLEYIPGYLKDTYTSDTRCVNDSSASGIVSKGSFKGQNNATIIDYTPKSSTTAASNGDCTSGSGNKGNTVNTTIPKANSSFDPNNVGTWRGRLEFRIGLKNDLLSTTNLKIGDVLEPNGSNSSVGIQGEFSLNGIVIGGPQYAIKISGLVVSQSTIVSTSCVGQPVLIGENAQCGFRLTGGNNTTNPYLLPDNFKVQIGGSTGFATKDNCQIDNQNSLLTCAVPTVNAAAGKANPVNVTLSGTTATKTTIDLITDFDPKGDFDKDGISNEVECGFTSGRNCADTDKEGILDYKDVDSDNDGISDAIEAKCNTGVGTGSPCDTDGDSTTDFRDTDSDNDGKPDNEEKGTLNCDMTKIPAVCTGELRDTDNDGIPNFRDKDDGNIEVRYLIDDSQIKFNYENQPKPIWGLADLTLNIDINQDIIDCEVQFRKYASTDSWITTPASIDNQKCKTVLTSDKQYTQKWDLVIILTDKNKQKWGAYPSYSMENGSVGGTTIEAKTQDATNT